MRKKRNLCAWAAAGAAGLLAASVAAGSQTGELPAFEVASVKLSPPGSVNHTDVGPLGGGSFTAGRARLTVSWKRPNGSHRNAMT